MFTSLALLVLAGLLGPLLAAGRRPRLPVLVGELIAGAILGKTGLHLINPAVQPFPVFSALGFAMLMLLAGTEVDLSSKDLRSGALRGAQALLLAFAVSIPIGLAIGGLLGVDHPQLFIVLLAGSSAAVAFPIIRERELHRSAMSLVVAWIALADALTVLIMPLTLSEATRIPGALLGDAMIVVVAGGAVGLGRRLFNTPPAQELKEESKHRNWALRLRISILLLLVLGAIAERTGASLLVAGFAAGIALGQFHRPRRLVLELTGLATGFFVPAFFVLLGATLDLQGLLHSPRAIVVALTMAVGATAAHVVAALVAGEERRVAAGLLASAQIGLPAAAAALGLASGALTPPVAAALVAGGLLTLIPASLGAAMLARTPRLK